MTSINIYPQIGLVTLIGLISKHGILMVDFANRLQEEGRSRREAIEEAAAVRLRPILMTTAAIVLAMIPLIMASGAGARSRSDLGLVIAAGKIGRAACREGVCQSGEISVVAVSLKKKKERDER